MFHVEHFAITLYIIRYEGRKKEGVESLKCEIWEESIRFLVKSLVVHQIFTKFAIGLVTGQVKVLAWSRYDAEKQDYLVDTSKLFSSVGWNLVNWNVERTRICLSESTPSYGVDSSFAFSFLRVLPEPNLQESEESRGSHHLFSLMDHYELVWFAEFS